MGSVDVKTTCLLNLSCLLQTYGHLSTNEKLSVSSVTLCRDLSSYGLIQCQRLEDGCGKPVLGVWKASPRVPGGQMCTRGFLVIVHGTRSARNDRAVGRRRRVQQGPAKTDTCRCCVQKAAPQIVTHQT